MNLTNDAWFGRTRAPYLHRSLAAFRAVENRVYLVRATNTGLTSIIDAHGREQTALPLYQRDTLVHTIQPLRLSTLYTRFGDWFAQLCSIVALVLPVALALYLASSPMSSTARGRMSGRTPLHPGSPAIRSLLGKALKRDGGHIGFSHLG